jgi:hypothetical protein
MIAALAALLLATGPPASAPPAPHRADAGQPGDEELLRHLDLLEQLDLLDKLDLLVPEAPKKPPSPPPAPPPVKPGEPAPEAPHDQPPAKAPSPGQGQG